MIINLFINRKFLYEFEINFIKELYREVHDLEIFLIVLPILDNVNSLNNRTISFIDGKFSNFRKSALKVHQLEGIVAFFPKIKLGNKEILKPDVSVFFHQETKPVTNTLAKVILSFAHSETELKQQVFSNNNIINIEVHKFDGQFKEWRKFVQFDLNKENGYKNSLDKYYYYSSVLMLKALRIIHNNINYEEQSTNIIKRRRIPKFIYYGNLLQKIIRRKFQNKRLNWKIVIKNNEQNTILNPKKGSFWADPFYVKNNGNHYIFIEEFNYSTNLGEIAVLDIDAKFNVQSKSTILKEHFHFSFPNVFEYKNEIFMLPETSQNNELAVYKCEKFPYNWVKYFTLMKNIKLVDAVWVKHEDYYYIFANKIQEFEYDNNECLYIYYSDDLFSNEWHSHALNPVITNLNCARNAGKIFKQNGKMFRPSQNCERSYGEEVNIREILELSPTVYKEKSVRQISPPKGFVGLHTYNIIDDNIVLVDLLKKE